MVLVLWWVPHHVITCAHNVYNHQKGWAEDIEVYPALNGKAAPFGSAKVTKVYTFRSWLTQAETICGIERLLKSYDLMNEQIKKMEKKLNELCKKDKEVQRLIPLTSSPRAQCTKITFVKQLAFILHK